MTTSTDAVDPATGRRGPGVDDLDRLTLLSAVQAEFAARVPATDPEARVPACGRWRVRHLVVHLGRIHHWAAGQARRCQETPLGRGPFDLDPFYASQAAELRETLAALGPDATAWTLLGTGPASFWHRRQLHETVVHLHDLRAAGLGSGPDAAREPVDVPAAVWADGVDEVVRMFQPRQVRLGRVDPLPRTVRLVASDVGERWTLGAHEDGRRPDDPAATLAAPARELALLLWRRLTTAESGVRLDGDEAAVRAALAPGVVP